MDKLECYEKQVYALESGNLRKTFELANNIIKIKYKGLEKKKKVNVWKRNSSDNLMDQSRAEGQKRRAAKFRLGLQLIKNKTEHVL